VCIRACPFEAAFSPDYVCLRTIFNHQLMVVVTAELTDALKEFQVDMAHISKWHQEVSKAVSLEFESDALIFAQERPTRVF